MRGGLPCIARTTLQMLIAGVTGAFFDELGHRGVSAWLTMCSSGNLPLASVLSIQLTLMPAMLASMLGVAVVQLGYAFRHGVTREPLVVGACHLGCFLAMVTICDVGAQLFAKNGTAAALAGMFAIELGIGMASGVALYAFLRPRWQ